MQRPGFMLFICPDGRLIRDAVGEHLRAHATAQSWQRLTFWGDEELPAAFWEALTLQALFSTPKALVVRNAHNLTADIWKRLNTALAVPNTLSWPLLCLEGGWEKGQPKIPAHLKKLPCFAHAEKNAWVWQHPPLDARAIRRHVQDKAKAHGCTFAPGALEALAASLPPDAATIDNELAKLLLLAEGSVITAENAARVEHMPDFDIFGFLRRLQAGDAAAVWHTVLREQGQGDEIIFPLLGLLQREARLLWQVRAGENPRLHPSDAAAKRDTANRLGFTGLAALWDAALTAELSIKSGARSPAQALDALLGDLTRLFAPAARR